MSNEEQLGYIKGKVEALEKDIQEVRDSIKEHREQEAEHNRQVLKELRTLREEQSMYRHVWWTIKAVALTVAGVVTLRFGDFITLFKGIK